MLTRPNAEIIQQVYTEIKRTLPPDIAVRLKFASPDQPVKHGGKIWRGRILGLRNDSIFDSAWCFYEIGIGHYGTAPTKQGGVGFVCYPSNKKCGHGAHSASVFDVMSRFTATHPQFPSPARGDKKHALFTYYVTIPPLEQPLRDLCDLILCTFISLERLHVSKNRDA